MRLRLRIALLVGAAVAIAVVGVTAVAVWSVERELFDPVDERLAGRLEVVQEAVTEGRATGRNRPLVVPGPGVDQGDERLGFGQVLVIGADGEPVEVPGTPLPLTVHDDIDARAPASADATGEAQLFDTEIDGVAYRIGRIELDDAVLYLGQDVSGLHDSVSSLRRRLVVIGLGGVALALVAGWLIALRVSRPIRRVAGAAVELAENSRLPERIETRRRDEVGDLADSFNQLLDALETSRVQQQRLVSDASHELRTPLTSLRLRIETLGEHPEMAEERRRQLVDSAVRELTTLTSLVEELVDLAADVEHAEEPATDQQLAPLVIDAAEAARLRTGRAISVETDDTTAAVAPRLYTRALANLLDNAIKYSPEDSPVAVRQKGGAVEVIDRGAGVTEEQRSLVFNRFYRGPEAQTKPGSGIGLAIVQHVAERHGGGVWFEPEVDGGSRVGFRVAG